MASIDTLGTGAKPAFRVDLIAWGVLGLAAIMYLGVLFVRPDMMNIQFRVVPAEQESNRGTRSLSKALAELKNLNTKTRKLRHEISRLRSINAAANRNTGQPAAMRKVTPVRSGKNIVKPAKGREARTSQNKPTNQKRPTVLASTAPSNHAVAETSKTLAAKTVAAKRLAAKTPVRQAMIPQAVSPPTRSPATSDSATPASVNFANLKIINSPVVKSVQELNAAIATTTSAKPIKKITSAPAKKPRIAVPPVDIFTKPAAKIVTGSIKPPPVIAFGVPVIRRAKPRLQVSFPPVGVQLASAASIAMLRVKWLSLTDRFGALSGLEPHYEIHGTGLDRYRLVAGPLSSTAQAISLCDHLTGGEIPCTVSTLAGRKL